jgi:XRE family transcriptional regulator of biofilm formation
MVITKLREGQRLTQRELAKKAKVTAAYVAMIETGVRKNPSLAILKRLAKALGVPVTALLE